MTNSKEGDYKEFMENYKPDTAPLHEKTFKKKMTGLTMQRLIDHKEPTLTVEPAKGYNGRVHSIFGIHFLMPKNTTRRELVEKFFGNNDVKIIMPCCKKSYSYKHVESFPLVDTPCSCGAENRLVVKYEDEKDA